METSEQDVPAAGPEKLLTRAIEAEAKGNLAEAERLFAEAVACEAAFSRP
ncbi:MAG: hypothetical protein IMZ44_11920 [Planctomycetes bacterium]|nr:hypothetical protein [Planctomycetota bacterium]